MLPREPRIQGNLEEIIAAHSILITVGSGGVGKTSIAATIGLIAARMGRRTIVLTIDPARRLATSLGLHELTDASREVPHELLRPHGIPAQTLHAMMLDPRQTFDQMVFRFAESDAAARRLVGSKLYQQIASKLAGAQEYAAMEKLHAIHEEKRYELIVLDTPPTANAMDFLEAPAKMIAAVDSPVVQLLVNAHRAGGPLSLDALSFGAAYVMRRLARFTGGGFLDDISVFLGELSGVLGGMQARAERVQSLLQAPTTRFVIVASPDPRSVDEALAFSRLLAGAGMAVATTIVNRLHVADPLTPSAAELLAWLGSELPVVAAAELGPLAVYIATCQRNLQALASADAEEMSRLNVAHGGRASDVMSVPMFADDIHDVDGLMTIARCLSR